MDQKPVFERKKFHSKLNSKEETFHFKNGEKGKKPQTKTTPFTRCPTITKIHHHKIKNHSNSE